MKTFLTPLTIIFLWITSGMITHAQGVQSPDPIALLQVGLDPTQEAGDVRQEGLDLLTVPVLPSAETAQDIATETLMRTTVSSLVSEGYDHGGVAAARAAGQFFVQTAFSLKARQNDDALSLHFGEEEIPADQAAARLSALASAFAPRTRRMVLAHVEDTDNRVPVEIDALGAALRQTGFDVWVLIVAPAACRFDSAELLLSLLAGFPDRAPFGDGNGSTNLLEIRAYLDTLGPRTLRRGEACQDAYILILPGTDVQDSSEIVKHDVGLSFRDLDSVYLVESFDAAYLAQSDQSAAIESYLASCRICPDAQTLEARLSQISRRSQLAQAEDSIWQRVSTAGDFTGLNLYVTMCQLCTYRDAAQDRLDQIAAEAEARTVEANQFAALQGSDDIDGLRAYLTDCVYCADKDAVTQRLTEIADQAAYQVETETLAQALAGHVVDPVQDWLDTCRWCDGKAQAEAKIARLEKRGTYARPCLLAAGLPQFGGPRLLSQIDIAQAAVACESALDAYPGDPEFQMLRGRVYHAQGAIKEAKQGYDAGRDAGLPAAFGLLGYLLYEPPAGSDLVQDFDRAAALAEQGAEQGDWLSRQLLSALYSQSLVRGKTPQDAVLLSRAGADEGDPVAQFFTGYFHLKGLGHPEPNATAAVTWLEQAKNQGYLPANAFLAEAMETDPELDADLAVQAVTLLLDGAKGGDPVALAKITTGLRDRQRLVVRSLQSELRDQGVYRGGIDGVPGPGTVRAVEALIAQSQNRDES